MELEALDEGACTQELAESDSLEDGPLLDGATFHNLARQCRLEPSWHEQVQCCPSPACHHNSLSSVQSKHSLQTTC